jgi:hypothetical protein
LFNFNGGDVVPQFMKALKEQKDLKQQRWVKHTFSNERIRTTNTYNVLKKVYYVSKKKKVSFLV